VNNDVPPTIDVPPAVDASVSSDVLARCEASTAVVSFTTSDGVRLEADLATPGLAGGPGAILLHMIPPSNDRSNYPRDVVEALVARGVTVLNVDRRGAGNSDGVARDAYLGPGGARDVQAAFEFLRAQPCAVDPSRVVLVGASNGSASVVDYVVAADDDTRPAGIVFLTSGTYTEAQTRYAAHRDRLDATPSLFVYSRVERAWSAALQPGAPARWTFREYDPGAHGTGMFAPQPGVVEVIADFVGAARR
jgi:predicted alpha/beta-fold hydrolase